MATKRRRVPTAVQEQLERKQRQAATMAERQGAALGKPAREQLRPLLKTPRAEAPAETTTTIMWPSLSVNDIAVTLGAQSFRDALMSGVWVRPFGRAEVIPTPKPPSVDPNKLAALRTAEPYKVEQRVPDVVEVITGWRAWMLSKSGRLEALGRDTVWPARQALIAECDPGPWGSRVKRHIAPAMDCNCGVWAFKDLERLVAALGDKYNAVCVLGTVSLWGRVVETENGYRAQYAYPSELWLLDDSLEELGLTYGVPVRTVKG